MNKKKILLSAPYLQLALNNYQQIFNNWNIEYILPNIIERMEEKDLLELENIENIDGTICGDDKFTKKVIDKANNLKVIVKWGTGIDSIDKDYAATKGIKVINTPDAFIVPVSDTVLGFILNFARSIISSDKLMKEGKWSKLRGFTLEEKKLGIIGLGKIGKEVARKARAFNMEVIANDTAEIPETIINELGIKMVSLNELLTTSDIITTNCDLNPTSYHLLDEEQFNLMKKGTYLINTARGPIINEKAMTKALENEKLAGVGLDVYEHEPLPVNSPLRKMGKAILASHNSNNSPKYWDYVHKNSIIELLSNLFDKTLSWEDIINV
ncbi:MAG: NAD(P)-binding domain-containing protein [Spirochaetes bacterium]|nr:NAD(P)-binding domain-containing protein [Spirochaetota bacterium]